MSKPLNDVKIFLINESDTKSVISDISTFGCLVGAFWFNHEFLGDGVILQIVLGLAFFIVAAGRGSAKVKRMSRSEAQAYFSVAKPTDDASPPKPA